MTTADPKKKKKKRKKKESLEHKRNRILVALGIFAVVYALDELGTLTAAFGTPGDIYASFALFLVPFLIAGYDVLQKAYNNIRRGKAFDESFLMAVATIGAFAMVLFPDTDPHMAEGAAVMLFYQVGELFQAYAVGKSRKSISAMMDIAPDYANVEQPDGSLEQVFPDDIAVGTVIVVKPGERVPIDGVIVEGETQLDTAALTGESVPRPAKSGDDIISGCINMTGLIHVRTTKPFGESTVARVLELVENASEKKARTENFITRFARVYTPAVTGAAAVLALGGGLVTGAWSDWILRGLTFLVVSCPASAARPSWAFSSRAPTTSRRSPTWTPSSSTKRAPSPTARSQSSRCTPRLAIPSSRCSKSQPLLSRSLITPSRSPCATPTRARSTPSA